MPTKDKNLNDGTIGERELAALVGVSLSSVQNRRKGGLLPSFQRDSCGRLRAPRDAALAEWGEIPKKMMVRMTPGPAADGDGETLAEARTRLETAKAALAEMDLAERRAELLPAANVEQRLVTLFGGCRTKLLGVPAAVRQRDPSLSKEQLDMIEDAIREALEDLAGGAVDDGDGDAGDGARGETATGDEAVDA